MARDEAPGRGRPVRRRRPSRAVYAAPPPRPGSQADLPARAGYQRLEAQRLTAAPGSARPAIHGSRAAAVISCSREFAPGAGLACVDGPSATTPASPARPSPLPAPFGRRGRRCCMRGRGARVARLPWRAGPAVETGHVGGTGGGARRSEARHSEAVASANVTRGSLSATDASLAGSCSSRVYRGQRLFYPLLLLHDSPARSPRASAADSETICPLLLT